MDDDFNVNFDRSDDTTLDKLVKYNQRWSDCVSSIKQIIRHFPGVCDVYDDIDHPHIICVSGVFDISLLLMALYHPLYVVSYIRTDKTTHFFNIKMNLTDRDE